MHVYFGGKKISYDVVPSKSPLEADSTLIGHFTVGDKVPEAYRDMLAIHEYTEHRGIMNANPPVVKRSLRNRIFGGHNFYEEDFFAARNYCHREACRKEIEMAGERGILPEYIAWRIAELMREKGKQENIDPTLSFLYSICQSQGFPMRGQGEFDPIDPIQRADITARLSDDIVFFESERKNS